MILIPDDTAVKINISFNRIFRIYPPNVFSKSFPPLEIKKKKLSKNERNRNRKRRIEFIRNSK